MFTMGGDQGDATDVSFRSHGDTSPGDDVAVDRWDAMRDRIGSGRVEAGVAYRLVIEAASPGAVAALFPAAASLDADSVVDVEWLVGEAANELAVSARRTDAFARLLEVVRKRQSRIRPITETTTVVRVTDGERVREVVAFDVDTLQADTAHLTVVRHPRRGTSAEAALEYTTRDEEGNPESATVYLTDGVDVDRRTVDPAVARAAVHEGERRTDAPSSTVGCDCCRTAVGVVRWIGPTAPLTFSSALLGPSEIGRFDALSFVAVVWDADEDGSERVPASDICGPTVLDCCQ